MREVLPGIYHWKTYHDGIGQSVHSYYIGATSPAVLIDPRQPRVGMEWFSARQEPKDIFLTNRHHYRHSAAFAAAFGAQIWCHEKGLAEFTHGERIKPFKHGAKLPGGVIALQIGALCEEETAFYLPIHGGVLAVGDALIRARKSLAFVPDELMGDDPEKVKAGLKAAFRKQLAEHPVKHLLLAHGAPVIGNAGEQLARILS